MTQELTKTWIKVADVATCATNGGVCVKWGSEQIAVFNLGETWYATQNRCPHRQQEVLSRGLLGDAKGEPKIACPLHKNNFSLRTGEHLGAEDWTLKTYDIKVENASVYLLLEPLPNPAKETQPQDVLTRDSTQERQPPLNQLN